MCHPLADLSIKQIYWIIWCVTLQVGCNKTDLCNDLMCPPSVGLSIKHIFNYLMCHNSVELWIKQIYWIIRCVTFSWALHKADLLNYQMYLPSGGLQWKIFIWLFDVSPSVELSINQIYSIIRCVTLQVGWNKTDLDLLNYQMAHPSVGLSIKQIYWIIWCVTL